LEVLRKSLKPLSKGFAEDTQPYIDVMLIHAPWGGAKGRAENWKALVAAQKEGWIKDIGVSNLCVAWCGSPLHSGTRGRAQGISQSPVLAGTRWVGEDPDGYDRSNFVSLSPSTAESNTSKSSPSPFPQSTRSSCTHGVNNARSFLTARRTGSPSRHTAPLSGGTRRDSASRSWSRSRRSMGRNPRRFSFVGGCRRGERGSEL
jgi:hypothetical protein